MKKILKQFLGSVEDKNAEEGTFVVSVSTEDVDRESEVLRASGFELGNFRKNPVVLWAHRYIDPPVGKALWIKVVGNKLKAKVKFAPTQFAQDIRTLYEEGFLRAWSVGFIPKKWVDGEEGSGVRREYTKLELLEFSGVPVPCNPEALTEGIKMVKDAGMKAILEEMLGKVNKPEETDDYIRIPVEGEEGKHDGHKIRTITVSAKKGIKALYCVDCKKIITYLFDKSCKNKPNKCDWTMEQARAWMDEHGKEISAFVETEIEGLVDEEWEKVEGEGVDGVEDLLEEKAYTCECIKCGHKVETEKHCKDVKCPKCGGTMRRAERPGPGQPASEGVEESEKVVTISESLDEFSEGKIEKDEMLKRVEGALKSIVEKVGAVLSKKNKDKLIVAKNNIQTVLEAAETNESDDGKAVSLEGILRAIEGLKEALKEKKVEEVIEIEEGKEKVPPEKPGSEDIEISGMKVEDIQTMVRDIVGGCLDGHIREIRARVFGKVT